MSDDLRTLLGEWKAMEAAATEGPWEADGGEIGQHWSLPEPWQKVVQTDVACMSYCYGGTSAGVERVEDAAFIATSRTLVPRLIAAVEAVLALAEEWRYKGEYGDGPWQLGEGPDQEGQALDEASSQLRAAIHASLIGDDDDR